MSKTLIPFLLAIFIVTGCRPYKNISNEKLIRLTDTNIRKLEGVYFNSEQDSSGYFSGSFWSDVNYGIYLDHPEYYVVRIKRAEKKRIQFELLLENEVVGKKTIHGKIKDGFFYRHRTFFFIPLVVYTNMQYRIELNEDGVIVNNSIESSSLGGEMRNYSIKKFKKL